MPLSQKTLRGIAFGAPTPGQSLTTPPKNMPFEHPPQFTKLDEVMGYMMDQLTEPQHMTKLLQMIESKMPIEAITRTLLFTGFASGKWSVDLALLMYKPLMLALIAIAHRAGLKDSPVIMPKAVTKQRMSSLREYIVSKEFSKQDEPIEELISAPEQEQPKPQSQGFMQRGNV